MMATKVPAAARLQKLEIQMLIEQALSLGAREVKGWSNLENELIATRQPSLTENAEHLRSLIRQGEDPLGESFCRIFSAADRRPKGAVYTPATIVIAMLDWASDQVTPRRIVDPGVGSGRFLVEAGRRFPEAELVGVEIDPLAALLARAHLAVAGMADRSRILLEDYRQVRLDNSDGQTLFIGNPPYVRHHLIDDTWKRWLSNSAKLFNLKASGLSGLHIYFLLATALLATSGDVGTFITSSEWLDVNYGRLGRELLLGALGLTSLQIIEPSLEPFPGTQSTAVISGFKVGTATPSIHVRQVRKLCDLTPGRPGRSVKRGRFAAEHRWTLLAKKQAPKRVGFVQLGEICRVHRGQVTGANNVWIATDNKFELPLSVLKPTVTKARELFDAGGELSDARSLKKVVDLPIDLAVFAPEDKSSIESFLRFALSHGVDQGYVARNRRVWWSVGLKAPAPILASYMARRSPVFVLNTAEARHINIAHGLYPVEPLNDGQLGALAAFLSSSVSTDQGRTYAGGLTKFEPREMERLLVPLPEHLLESSLESREA